MPYDLALVDVNRNFEIIEMIERVESIEWGDNTSRAHTYLNFTTGNNQNTFDELFTTVYNCGDWVGLFDRDTGALILYAVITKVSRESLNSYSYQCYDLGFYLWKNKVTRDFNGETLQNAIINVCENIQLRSGNIPNINFNITQIYRNRIAFEIFQDIYRQAVRSGIRDQFYFDCKNGRVNLFDIKKTMTYKDLLHKEYKQTV